MSSSMRRWAVVALVAAFVVAWRAETNQDVAAAQARKPIMMTRIYTGTDGLSHSAAGRRRRSATGTSVRGASS